MGLSFFQRRPVTDILLEVLPNSLILTLSSLIVAYMFGVLAGAWLAWKRGSWIERVAVPVGAGDARRARVLDRHGAARAAVVQCRLVPVGRRQQPRPGLHQQLAAHRLARLCSSTSRCRC